ncbi:class I SAM-dependent methyltransferase [Aquabacterium sp. OR-4]|uniref:class I SAM-dependent methyltransferase n=1 Tax=Aquabacterium sp. OR-4 TaxID=2978127 RepID=UPI0021B30ABE|nr:class I SAM-dependent methyltransferase [Aquabacterium sp. OR-4]MDT7836611.1 class I SAM-dependent methyltransferase [Aquabacterium sp. OR-4]
MSPALPPIRQTSPAAERNKAPILAELLRLLPAQGAALEVAAGTGQHAAHFAAHLPGWTWQPTDPDAAALSSIAAWRAQAQAQAHLPGLLPPQQLDVLAEPWPVTGLPGPIDLLYCANMLHIAPWACCAALMRGAAQRLAPAGQLITYGPYLVEGEPTAPGNLAFDADLRQRNPAWGLRQLGAVATAARAAGLQLHEQVAMPANNRLLVFRRHPPHGG